MLYRAFPDGVRSESMSAFHCWKVQVESAGAVTPLRRNVGVPDT